tara:strand:- start:8494 stop:9363 length:870 start_codon:yes stop_codon:yes gene_type:complete
MAGDGTEDMPPNNDIGGDLTKKEILLQPSTLENIDYAMYNWINEVLDIHTENNEGWRKVPVKFVSPERAFLSKNDQEIRDEEGSLIFPLISVERKSVTKDLRERAGYGAYIFPPSINSPYDAQRGSITIARQVQHEKTADRANVASLGAMSGSQPYHPVENKKVVYETITVPYPVHLTIMYAVNVRTEYAQQMNDVLSVFMTKTGALDSFLLRRNGHTYESFIQGDYSLGNNIGMLQLEERKHETQLMIKVIGYIMGADRNEESPKIVVREGRPDIRFKQETVLKGEIP